MKFNKTLVTLFASFSALFSVQTSVAEEEKILHVYNWNEYIEPSIIPEFEKETGIKVIYDLFDSNEVLEAKLFSGKSGYDIVVPGSDFLFHQIKAGIYMPLDKSKLPNYKNLDPVKMEMLAKLDENNTYGIPYLTGTTGIGYNKELIKKHLGEDFVVNSWDVFFKPEILGKLKSCGVAVLDAPTEVLSTAMHYLGKNPNSKNPKEYKDAEELMKKMRPNVTYFHSSQNINDLAAGDICITLGWSGDLLQARDRAREVNNGVDIDYVVPKEGALIFYDMLAIPKDADHPENAHLFINYLLRPDVMAKISTYTSYDSGNKAAEEFVADEVKNNPNIFIPSEKMQKMFLREVLPQKVTKELNKIWTRVKAGE